MPDGLIAKVEHLWTAVESAAADYAAAAHGLSREHAADLAAAVRQDLEKKVQVLDVDELIDLACRRMQMRVLAERVANSGDIALGQPPLAPLPAFRQRFAWPQLSPSQGARQATALATRAACLVVGFGAVATVMLALQ